MVLTRLRADASPLAWCRRVAGLCLLATLSSLAAAQTVAPPERVDRLMIRYLSAGPTAPSAGVSAAAQDAPSLGATRVARSAERAGVPGMHYLRSVAPQLHVARLDQALSVDDAQALVRKLRADPTVAAVAIDRRVRPQAVTDPYAVNTRSPYYQWHLKGSASVAGGMNAEGAWSGSTGTGVVVAVLDSGYRPHADLLPNLVTPGFDFIREDSVGSYWTANDGDGPDADAQDPGDWIPPADASRCPDGEPTSSWHGTHVAGLVAAAANGSDGVGVAYGARVLPVRVLGRCGGYLSDVLAGARWAAGLSTVAGATPPSPAAKVLNLSLSVSGACDSITQSVVDEIRAAGVSIVAAAGNEAATHIDAPANCAGVVAVTAHTRSGQRAGYANVGAGVAVSAPGGDSVDPVISTWNLGSQTPGADSYGAMAGTSMASPMAAGVLALMSSARPDLHMASLEALMRGAARAFPADGYCATNPDRLLAGFCGSGLLDAGLAVAAAQAADATRPDLEITQRHLSGNVSAGQTVSYSITVHNWGAVTATSVQVSAALSSDLGIESVIAAPSGLAYSFSAHALAATPAPIGPGQSIGLTLVVRIGNAPAALSSVAQTSAADPEISTANNRDTLQLANLVDATAAPVTGSGGGGCSVGAGGQTDVGLPLLALVAVLAVFGRRRAPAASAVSAPRR